MRVQFALSYVEGATCGVNLHFRNGDKDDKYKRVNCLGGDMSGLQTQHLFQNYV
jgi:hypothetical protein